MLKFIQHNFDGMNGIEIYPIISLVLFFIVFITMFIIVMNISKKRIDEVSHLPLEDDDTISKENNHE